MIMQNKPNFVKKGTKWHRHIGTKQINKNFGPLDLCALVPLLKKQSQSTPKG